MLPSVQAPQFVERKIEELLENKPCSSDWFTLTTGVSVPLTPPTFRFKGASSCLLALSSLIKIARSLCVKTPRPTTRRFNEVDP